MRKSFFLFAMMLPASVIAQDAIVGLQGVTTPESAKVFNNELYVTNLGEPNKPADGFIIKRGLDGSEQKILLGAKLDSPKGFDFLDKNVMLIADQVNDGSLPGNLVLADVTADKILYKYTMKGSKFLNDVAALGGGKFAVSDSGANSIYIVTVKKDAKGQYLIDYTTLTDKVPGANGLYYEPKSKTLFAASSTFGGDPAAGQLYTVSLTDGKLTPLTDYLQIGRGGLDGLKMHENKLYVSDWGQGKDDAAIYVLEKQKDGKYTVYDTYQSNFNGAADFDIYGTYIYLPEMTTNQVRMVKIGGLSSGRGQMDMMLERVEKQKKAASAQPAATKPAAAKTK